MKKWRCPKMEMNMQIEMFDKDYFPSRTHKKINGSVSCKRDSSCTKSLLLNLEAICTSTCTTTVEITTIVLQKLYCNTLTFIVGCKKRSSNGYLFNQLNVVLDIMSKSFCLISH